MIPSERNLARVRRAAFRAWASLMPRVIDDDVVREMRRRARRIFDHAKRLGWLP